MADNLFNFDDEAQTIYDDVTSPDFPKTKKMHEVINQIIADNPCLLDKEAELKEIIIKHYKFFFEYSRNLKKGQPITPGHSVLMDGLIARSLNIVEAMLREFSEKDMFSFHCLIRAHIETLALIHYLNKNNEYTNAAVNGFFKDEKLPTVNIMTMIKHATKKYPLLGKNYDFLSELVHPNGMSLRTNLNLSLNEIKLHSHLVDIPEQQAEEEIGVLIDTTNWIFEEIKELNNFLQITRK